MATQRSQKSWPTYYKYPPLAPVKPAIDPNKLIRLKKAGEIAHEKLERLPKEIARLYLKQITQLQDLIERLSK